MFDCGERLQKIREREREREIKDKVRDGLCVI